jgi:hypothetical protein
VRDLLFNLGVEGGITKGMFFLYVGLLRYEMAGCLRGLLFC